MCSNTSRTEILFPVWKQRERAGQLKGALVYGSTDVHATPDYNPNMLKEDDAQLRQMRPVQLKICLAYLLCVSTLVATKLCEISLSTLWITLLGTQAADMVKICEHKEVDKRCSHLLSLLRAC